MSSNNLKGKDAVNHHHHHHHQHHEESSMEGGSRQQRQSGAAPLSRYESQKRRDWNTFCQYLKNQRPPINMMSHCTPNHVLDFLRYLDQFGKTKVHLHGCVFFGQPEPPGPCTCPLRQAWGSLDALIGRLRAAYEENGGPPETNPFASGVIRMYLREVRDSQAKARGVPYKKKKKKRSSTTHLKAVAAAAVAAAASAATTTTSTSSATSASPTTMTIATSDDGFSRFPMQSPTST